MRRPFVKLFTFWFLIFSVIICMFNSSGNDDYNILIFITNPFNMLLKDWITKINMNPDTTHLFRPIIYTLHLTFWIILGLVIDGLIRWKKSKKPN